jgi:4-hydroxy-2-oxoheptanedioate aldolase
MKIKKNQGNFAMSFTMRRSRVLKKLRNGETALCFKSNFSDSRIYEIIARHGFDCVWACMEHTPNDFGDIEKAILATKIYDCDLLCRVQRGSYSDYIRPLELDAAGIMVPHVMSLEDAKNVVSMTRFPPVGRRPVDGGNADAFYCNVPFKDYLKQANEERFVILQIEDPEALNDLEAIAELEGYDMLFFGPGDYSVTIGMPGELWHPEVDRVRKLVADAAKKYGKFAGTVGRPDTKDKLIDMGYSFINIGSSVGGFSQYVKEIASSSGIKIDDTPVAQYGEK